MKPVLIKRYFIQPLAFLALLWMAEAVAAEEVCNLQMDAGLRITPVRLEFFDDGKAVYQIVERRYLVVNGQRLSLSDAQQALVKQYDQQVRAMVPEVEAIALEGIDLAVEGITLAFDGLLGQRNDISAQLRNELQHLKGDVRRYFDSEELSFNNNQDNAPELFGKYFETRVERIVETSVQDSLGAIMVAVGKEVLSCGGNMDAFEARMERFGQEIETQMQSKSVRMEARGRELCRSVTALNATEDQLRAAVPNIRALDLIQVQATEQHANQKI